MKYNRKIIPRAASLLISAVLAFGSICAPVSAKSNGKQKKDKTETVYVNADATGNTEKITVSDHLSNEKRLDVIDDYSTLSDIKNVKGDEEYSQKSDGSLTWDAGGNEVYYQGTSDKKLPVSVKVTYFLDGKKVSPDSLAGKSGKVKIRFDYSNDSYETIKIKKETYTINTPFLAITAMILPAENFDNVEVENGQVVSDGDKNFVIGMAMPGLSDSLSLSGYEPLEDIDIPSFVEVKADARDFELAMTATAVTNGMLDDIDTGKLDDVDDLQKDMEDLTDASEKLVEGSKTLAEGIDTLDSGFAKYLGGVETASKGAKTLSEGLKTLDKNSLKLNDGADKLSEGLKQIKEGSKSLENGLKEYTDGVSTLDENLGKAYEGSKTISSGAEKIASGIEAYTDGVEKLVKGVNELSEAAKAFKNLKLPDEKEMAAAAKTMSDLKEKAENLEKGINQIKTTIDGFEETAGKLNEQKKAIDEKMKAVQSQAEKVNESASAKASQKAADKVNENIDKANEKIGKANSNYTKTKDALKKANDRLGDADGDISSAVAALKDIDTSGMTEGQKSKLSSAISKLGSINTEKASGPDEEEVGKIDKVSADDCKVNVEASSDLSGALKDLQEEVGTYTGYTQTLEKAVSGSLQGLKALSEGLGDMEGDAKALAEEAAKLQKIVTGVSSLTEDLPKLLAGIEKLQEGAKELGQVKSVVSQITSALNTLTDSLKALSEGSSKLSAQNSLLNEGAKTLASGAEQLYTGTNGLTKGLTTYTEGVNQAMQGGGQLASGMGLLASNGRTVKKGIGKLSKGADKLSSGMEEFDEKGIQKLSDLAGDDLLEVTNRFKAVRKADGRYDTFSGKSDQMSGSVKFIIETDEISLEDD